MKEIEEKQDELIEQTIHFLHNGAVLSLISDTNENSLLVQTYNKLIQLEKDVALLKSKRTSQGEYFRKVYIKSEADLPKENNNFFCCDKDDICKYLHFESLPAFNSKTWWMSHIAWYLLPVSEPASNGNAEEVDLIQYVTNLLYAAYKMGNAPTVFNIEGFDRWVEEQTGLLSEFASQSHKEVELPSDKFNEGYKKGWSDCCNDVKQNGI